MTVNKKFLHDLIMSDKAITWKPHLWFSATGKVLLCFGRSWDFHQVECPTDTRVLFSLITIYSHFGNIILITVFLSTPDLSKGVLRVPPCLSAASRYSSSVCLLVKGKLLNAFSYFLREMKVSWVPYYPVFRRFSFKVACAYTYISKGACIYSERNSK